MMANGWKTPKQIQQDYGISQGTFYDWKQKCESSQFKDAIIRPKYVCSRAKMAGIPDLAVRGTRKGFT